MNFDGLDMITISAPNGGVYNFYATSVIGWYRETLTPVDGGVIDYLKVMLVAGHVVRIRDNESLDATKQLADYFKEPLNKYRNHHEIEGKPL